MAFLKILILSALVFGTIQRAEATTWTTTNGLVLTQTGDPVCAMVLANGQYMFSCDGAGTYDLLVPLDNNNLITLQVFASGFAPFRQTLTAAEATGYIVNMERDTTGRAFTITHNVSPTSRNGWKLVSGSIHDNGTPLCAMILINGQSMFSCNQDLGQYSLEVPLDSNGRIPLQAFAAGFMPHRDTFDVNDPPKATGQCGTTMQADTYSHTLNANDPDSILLTYTLLDPADGTPAGNGPITTANGGTVEITDNTTGDFTYVPGTSAGDKRGLDSFQFRVSDTGGQSSSATESVIVNQTIMPLGDSITQGVVCITEVDGDCDFGAPEDRAGYRKPLYDTLITSGYTFDFVGTLDQGSAVLVDFDHEGHGGWTAFDIAWGQNPGTDGVFPWLDSNPADIILLHAGTNQLSITDESDIEDILDEIDRWENSADGNPVTVILARIIDRDSKDNAAVAAFNDAVEAMANSRIAAGDDIIIVDQQQAVNYDYDTDMLDMSDNLHPTDNGYAKMAPVWFDALETELDKCP